MKSKQKNSSRKLRRKTVRFATSLLRYLFLISLGYIVLFPLLSAISTAIKQEMAFYDASLYWLPRYVTFDNFKYAYDVLDYGKSIWRTLTLDVVSALIEVVVCAIIAYGFARFEFRGKKVFEFLLMVTIVVPITVYIAPMVTNFKQLDIVGILGLVNKLTGVNLRVNILNTNLPMYLPSLFGMGLRSGILIYIYIQFFRGLPKELEEAAYIDGAGPLRTFWRIAVPSSGVAILTVTVFSVIWHWNDYTLGLMYFTKDYPLAVQLANLRTVLATSNPYEGGAANIMKDPIVMAGCLLFITPLLIAYLCVQNRFVKSIDRVGITG